MPRSCRSPAKAIGSRTSAGPASWPGRSPRRQTPRRMKRFDRRRTPGGSDSNCRSRQTRVRFKVPLTLQLGARQGDTHGSRVLLVGHAANGNSGMAYGIHHVTAIAGPPRRNLDFYTRVLGLRLVKKTVNFDDPRTYHFYYGNESGQPG